MKKIEHIGIAVKDLELSCSIYEQLLGKGCYKKENVSSENVDTAFFLVGPNKIELLSATDKLGSISKFIENKGEGLHHIAFEVDDILLEMDRLKAEGFHLLSELPKPGADNKLVCFVHPKQASGVLIELCQEIKLG